MQTHRTMRPRCVRHLRSLLILLALFSLSVGMLGPIRLSVAQTAQTTPPDNPAANYSMWRDDELFLPKLVPDELTSAGYEYDSGDRTLSELSSCQPTKAVGPQMAAAAGRVTDPYSDQVMVASPFGALLMVSFADGCDLATGEASRPSVLLGGPDYPMPALSAAAGLPRFYDITTGDLDGQSPDDISLRDEVVVAYAGLSGELVVVVIDYTTTDTTIPAKPAVTWAAVPDAIPSNIVPVLYDIAPIPLAVTTGDFDDNGRKEIAVAYLDGSKSIGVATYRYATTEDADGSLTHALTQASTLTSTVDQPEGLKWTAEHWIGSLDAVAGDLDGDGKDELSVAATAQGKTGNIFHPNMVVVDLKTFRSDAELTLSQVAPNSRGTIVYDDVGKFGSTVQLASGLFKFAPGPDPVTDFGIDRRQIALATNGSSGAVALQTVVYDAALAPTVVRSLRIPGSGDPTERLKFWLAAGAFKGLRSAESEADVVWSLAFVTWDKAGQVLYLYDLDPATGDILGFDDSPYFFRQTVSSTPYPHVNDTSIAVAPLVAYDHGRPTSVPDNRIALRGDALYLSEPLHFTLDGYNNADYVLQEPPKHVFWDPEGGAEKKGAVVNVSAQDAFKVGRKDVSTIGVTKTRHDTYDGSIGASETISGELGLGGGLLKPKAEVKLTETFGYDHELHTDEYNKDMDERSVSLTVNAARDDALQYRVQTIDVWRYFIFGVDLRDELGNPEIGFFDITAARPGAQIHIVPGTAYPDLYQPIHENNNILSYPEPTLLPSGQKGLDPPDMGSFQVPCTDLTGLTCDKDPDTGDALTTITITGPLVDRETWVWGGISGELELKDRRPSTTGTQRTTSNSLHGSVDLKASVRFKPAPGVTLAFTGDVEFHERSSWGDVTTTESTTDALTSITFTVPVGESAWAYEMYPLFYNTADGTMKVAFAVDTGSTSDQEFSGKEFWDGHYGRQPDPALNLPHRFLASTDATGTVWRPSVGTNRKLMRGFFVRHTQPNPITGVYTQYSVPPNAGETVRLEARVHNYSTLKGVGPSYGTEPLKVRFEYVELDGTDEVLPRKLIGDTTVGEMAPRGLETASVNWTVPAFDGSSLSKNLRIYVVLDPDDAITDEKYDTESVTTSTYCAVDCAAVENWIDPGQNNEGYRGLTVTSFPLGAPRHANPSDVQLERDALAAVNPRGKLVANNVQAYVGVPLQIRVRIDTDEIGYDSQDLLLYDGDPNKGGTVIAGTLAFTGNPDGNEVWFEWTPTERGPRRLYAQVVESGLDTDPGNAVSGELKVEVIKAPQGPPASPGPTPR
jgi:hypothetical protein